MARLAVKVTANAASHQIVGWHDGALKIKVRAKAIKGQANAAVCKLIAQALDISTSQITVKSGLTNSRKVLEFTQLSDTELADKLAQLNTG